MQKSQLILYKFSTQRQRSQCFLTCASVFSPLLSTSSVAARGRHYRVILNMNLPSAAPSYTRTLARSNTCTHSHSLYTLYECMYVHTLALLNTSHIFYSLYILIYVCTYMYTTYILYYIIYMYVFIYAYIHTYVHTYLPHFCRSSMPRDIDFSATFFTHF